MNTYIAAFNQLVLVLKYKEIWLYLLPSVAISLVYYLLVYLLGFIGSILPDFIENALNTLLNQGYVFFILTLLSPVMGALSGKAESFLTSTSFQGGLVRLGKDTLRAAGILMVSFCIYFSFYLLWTMLAFMLHIQILSPLILFAVSAFFIGYSFIDYTLERHGLSVGKSIHFASTNGLPILILGLIFSLLAEISVVGVLLAPFLTTLYATCMCIELKKESK